MGDRQASTRDPECIRIVRRNLNPGEPGVLALEFHGVCCGDAGDVFHAFISELPWNSQAKWAAKTVWQFAVVHARCEERLRMMGIGHVDAVGPIRLNREILQVPRLRQHTYFAQHS